MNPSKTRYHLRRMKQKYKQLRSVELILWSAAIGIFVFCMLAFLSAPTEVAITVSCILACLAIISGSRQLRLFTIKESDLAIYLNQKYSKLQESADLLLREDHELTMLQQLQKSKTAERFEALYPTIKIPQRLGRAAAVFALSIVLSAGFSAFTNNQSEKQANEMAKVDNEVEGNISPEIKVANITINPPSYTGIKKHTTEDFNIKIPEGSVVSWQFSFVGNVSNPKMIISGRDTIALSSSENKYTLTKTFSSSAFYQLSWMREDSLQQFSDYGKIEVIKDSPPSIVVENLNQFLELSINDNLKVGVKASLRDDYALRDAYIIATVSKGTGEAIKFREEKLSFDAPEKIASRNLTATKLLDLKKLELGPGDELYFYIEAVDNKVPIFNNTRTETYFISLKDTSKVTTSVDATLGADLMPEYFRSQRQIIIDSEKLLKDGKRMAQKNFNERSNELAHDQKILRLRYGEFLGEEFESSVGPQDTDHDGNEEEVEKFGHSHDTENEHNLVEEQQSGQGKKQDPLTEFVHAHDGDEEATFFVQSIRAKLKAAVTIMWDAELYLRLYQPDKSLPYQYKALKLLKEISQESRIYVHRTGFDPPPLKEEKRLSGDLSEIKSSTSSVTTAVNATQQQITNALTVIEKLLLQDSITIAAPANEVLLKAGQALAQMELTMPGHYLETLSQLRLITQSDVSDHDKRKFLMKVRATFWKTLPAKTTTPHLQSRVVHDLDLQFLKSLSKLSN